MNLEAILQDAYPRPLVDALLASYREMEALYSLRNWKGAGLAAGHFVEAARRLVEDQLFGKHTPIGKPLPALSDRELGGYEQATGDEALRLLIPRTLRAMYDLRNKRGIGHLSHASPSEIDATFLLYSAKWVLAELLRQVKGLAASEVAAEMSRVVERQIGVLWKDGSKTRILDPSCPARDQVLVLLYDQDRQTVDELRAHVEYASRSNFRKILGRLHKSRLIELAVDGTCAITPTGSAAAEKIILRLEDRAS